MPLRQSELDALRAEIVRTGIDVVGLFRVMDAPPAGLMPYTVQNWFAGHATTARRDYYAAVLGAWRGLPDIDILDGEALGLGTLEYDGGSVVLNEAVRRRLKEWQDASGMGAVNLLSKAKADGLVIPVGLKHTNIHQWLSGATKSAEPEHLAFVAKAWADASERGLVWIELNDDIRAELTPLREAGLIPSRILKNAPDKPDGLTPAVISNWLSGKSRRLRKDHLDWVLQRCKALSTVSVVTSNR